MFTASGRSAIYQYLKIQRRLASPTRRVVLLPAFHCPTIVDPVLHAGFDVRFYAIDSNLAVCESDFLEKLDSSVVAALFIRYFGLGGLNERVVEASRKAGVRIIDDCSHSFLRAAPIGLQCAGADATTYSFWKLAPTICGGGLLLSGDAAECVLPRLKREGVIASLATMRTMLSQLSEHSAQLASDAFGVARPLHEDQLNPQPARLFEASIAYPFDRDEAEYRMPRIARSILGLVDMASLLRRRRRNYEIVAAGLQSIPGLHLLWGELPATACPWGFPILLDARPERDYVLRARGVPVFTFGEVLHPLLFEQNPAGSPMVADALQLSRTLLAISVHQGLAESSMQSSAARIRELSLNNWRTNP